jgi:hypothetical protein
MRIGNRGEKELGIAAPPETFFYDPHLDQHSQAASSADRMHSSAAMSGPWSCAYMNDWVSQTDGAHGRTDSRCYSK